VPAEPLMSPNFSHTLERLLAGHGATRKMLPLLVHTAPASLLMKPFTGFNPLSAPRLLPCFALNAPADNSESATKHSAFSCLIWTQRGGASAPPPPPPPPALGTGEKKPSITVRVERKQNEELRRPFRFVSDRRTRALASDVPNAKKMPFVPNRSIFPVPSSTLPMVPTQ
jgi:hypothetical protein